MREFLDFLVLFLNRFQRWLFEMQHTLVVFRRSFQREESNHETKMRNVVKSGVQSVKVNQIKQICVIRPQAQHVHVSIILYYYQWISIIIIIRQIFSVYFVSKRLQFLDNVSSSSALLLLGSHAIWLRASACAQKQTKRHFPCGLIAYTSEFYQVFLY